MSCFKMKFTLIEFLMSKICKRSVPLRHCRFAPCEAFSFFIRWIKCLPGSSTLHVPSPIFLDHFFIFQKNSLHLKLANFSSLKRRSIFTSRKILREKLELHSASKKSLNIAKMVEKRFELPTSTHDLSYEKIRLADCHKIPIFF